MASIKVSLLVVEVRTADGTVAWRRPSSTQYIAGYTVFNNGALPGDEAHEVLADDPATSNGVDIPSHNYLSGIEATVVGGDVGAGVVLPFDLSDPPTGAGFTFIIHLMLKKTASGTFPANVVVRLLRNTGSAVATFTVAQSAISYPAPGWHSITLTSEQVAAARADENTHIAVEISNGIPM